MVATAESITIKARGTGHLRLTKWTLRLDIGRRGATLMPDQAVAVPGVYNARYALRQIK